MFHWLKTPCSIETILLSSPGRGHRIFNDCPNKPEPSPTRSDYEVEIGTSASDCRRIDFPSGRPLDNPNGRPSTSQTKLPIKHIERFTSVFPLSPVRSIWGSKRQHTFLLFERKKNRLDSTLNEYKLKDIFNKFYVKRQWLADSCGWPKSTDTEITNLHTRLSCTNVYYLFQYFVEQTGRNVLPY